MTARSIRRALEIAGGPAKGARVVFPVDEREFFAAGFASSGLPETGADDLAAESPGALTAA